MVTATSYRNLLADNRRWDAVALRPGDIVISTPPKSGTTWMQQLCALLVFDGRPPDAPARLSPWVDMLTEPIEDVAERLEAQTHRRFLKTHTPLDGLPWRADLTYLVIGRDPRDVAFSVENHANNLDLPTLFSRLAATAGDGATAPPGPPVPALRGMDHFWQWVDAQPDPHADVSSLTSYLHHLAVAWERRDQPNVELFHYAELVADLPRQLARLARVLGLAVGTERIHTLAAMASFERMRAQADELAPNADHGHWLDNTRFFDQGPRRRWQDVLAPPDVARYQQRIDAIGLDPELSRWLHRG